MNLIFPLLYAPIVFFALGHYEVKRVSIIVFVVSLFWFFSFKKKKEWFVLQPLFYMFMATGAFIFDSFSLLKVLPLLISSFFSILLFISYYKKKSIILYFAEKFSKEPISESEKLYIHASTRFWFFVTLLNTAIHLSLFLGSNLDFWLYYSSIGWYFLFLGAGLIQFIHRHFIFLRRPHV